MSVRQRSRRPVGWQDIYPWDFAGQLIDITGVPQGDDRLCVTADPVDRFTEASESNDQAWRILHIAGVHVTLLCSGGDACIHHLPPELEPAA